MSLLPDAPVDRMTGRPYPETSSRRSLKFMSHEAIFMAAAPNLADSSRSGRSSGVIIGNISTDLHKLNSSIFSLSFNSHFLNILYTLCKIYDLLLFFLYLL